MSDRLKNFVLNKHKKSKKKTLISRYYLHIVNFLYIYFGHDSEERERRGKEMFYNVTVFDIITEVASIKMIGEEFQWTCMCTLKFCDMRAPQDLYRWLL